ncbi:EAL domain-containing protein [Sutcliffiella deserti]|uniref:EAL domain-containing protein n=1 Tax=Sutcliffiella deserti TaxID=2875501 RepID=UPI001CC08FEC|nr:EAL domain-containing protein [Sutcliffiella deserti]
MHCINCGVPTPLEEGGIFTVKSKTGLVGHRYASLLELERFVFSLQNKENNNDIEVKTSNMNGYYTLSNFSLMLQNHELVNLIAKGSFTTHFQPIIDLQNDYRLFAYECLLRPQSANNSVSPYELFEFARKTNLHNYLDQKAREVSIISSSKGKIPEDVKIFINFLPSSIYNPEFCLQHTFHIVDKYNIAANQLVFEVVESEKITDINHLESIFKTYKKSGMQVALDDVGAGYSTLEVLDKLRPDFVKIDRSYVSHCDTLLENQIFLQNVLEISEKLGIKVLAEGIERVEELEYCRKIGIRYAQGYYIGKPSPSPTEPSFAI